MTEIEQVKDFYDRESSIYDESRWKTEIGQYLNKTHQEIVLRLSSLQENGRWLDLGTGTGRFAHALRATNRDVVGVDISFSMLEFARQQCTITSEMSNPCHFVNGSGLQLPFANGSFDGCVAINVFSHLPTWTTALKEIHRVLRPEGCFIANFPNQWSFYLPYAVLVNRRRKSLRRGVYTRWFQLRELRRHFTRSGFVIDEMLGHFGFPSNYEVDFLLSVLKSLDHFFREGVLRILSPSLFVRLTKKEMP